MRILNNRLGHIILLLLLLGAAVALRLQDPPMIKQLRLMTFDYYNKVFPRIAHDGVAIVDINEDAIKTYGQWPWPRSLIADIPKILTEMGAKAVIFDIVFSEPDRTSPAMIADQLPQSLNSIATTLRQLPNNDKIFADSITAAGNVVMGFVASDQPSGNPPHQSAKFLNEGYKADPSKFVYAPRYFTTPLPELASAAAGNGSFTTLPETDGIIRRVPMVIGHRDTDDAVRNVYPSLAVEALRIAEKKNIYKIRSYGERHSGGYGITNIQVADYNIPTDENGNFYVYYTGHREHLYIGAEEILKRTVDQSRIKDKIIFIGTSAIGLLDLRSSPLNAVLPGVEVHAEMTEQILHNQFLYRPNYLNGAELIFTIVMSMLVIFIAPFISAGILAALGALLISSGSFISLYSYKTYGLMLDPIYPILAIITIYIVSSILSNLRSDMEKREIRKAFGQYLSPILIEELANNPDKLKLGGEVRELSIMFTDIRNFTTISQSMDPTDLTNMMSDFLTPMTACVLDHRGTVDKYMGDAMMAFWNAPLDDKEHAKNACTAALLMVKALAPVNDHLKKLADKSGKNFYELKAGIGIHTGKASVGNMGSKQRFAYSALGDSVNLASRLEGQTKPYGVSIMLSEATYQQASSFAAIEIDLLTVKGRTEPERVYTLLGDKTMATDADFIKFKSIHTEMLSAYRAQNWDEALNMIAKCKATRPDLNALYQVYIERIATYKSNPLPAHWTGVYVAADK